MSIQSTGAANVGAFAAMDVQAMQHGEPSSSYLELHEDLDREGVSATAALSLAQLEPSFTGQAPPNDVPKKKLRLKSLDKQRKSSEGMMLSDRAFTAKTKHIQLNMGELQVVHSPVHLTSAGSTPQTQQ